MVQSQSWRLLQLLYIFTSPIIVILMTTGNGKAERIKSVVETDPSVKLQNGSLGQLSCRVSIQPQAVYWTRGPTYFESITIMFMNPNTIDGIRGGPGYDDGFYNMTDDFTLVIDEVTFENEGLYFCEVVYNNEAIYNESSVLVYVLPEEPFPTIENCLNDSDAVTKGQNCSIYRSQLSHNITCSVWGYTPDITVSIYIRQASRSLEVADVSEWPDGNRTVGRSVTVMANASFEPYECRASYVAIKGEQVEKSATITLRNRPEQSSEGRHRAKEISIILALFLFSCIIPLMIVYVLALRQIEEVLTRNLWEEMCDELYLNIFRSHTNEYINTKMGKVFNIILFPLRSSFCFSNVSDLKILLPFPLNKPDLETYVVFFHLVMSYYMLQIGTLFKNDCPVEVNIPIYLIVMGSTSTLLCVIYLVLRYTWLSRLRDMKTRWNKNFWKSFMGMLVVTVIFLFCFIQIYSIAGNIWLYRIFWPNMLDPLSQEFCHPVPYYFLFSHLILSLIFYVCFAIGTWIVKYEKYPPALVIFIWPGLSAAMIVIGGAFKDNCPVEHFIPIYLIVMGSASILLVILCLMVDTDPLRPKDVLLLIPIIVLGLIILAFFLAGSVWIYRIVWPNMSDPTSPEYCHRTLYLFSFGLTTSMHILIGIIIVLAAGWFISKRC